MRIKKCIKCGGASTFGGELCVACELQEELKDLEELENE